MNLQEYVAELIKQPLEYGSGRKHDLGPRLGRATRTEVSAAASYIEKYVGRHVPQAMHGTSRKAAKKILTQGFQRGYAFFGGVDVAQYYARKRAATEPEQALIGFKRVSKLTEVQQKQYIRTFADFLPETNVHAAEPSTKAGSQFSVYARKGVAADLLEFKRAPTAEELRMQARVPGPMLKFRRGRQGILPWGPQIPAPPRPPKPPTAASRPMPSGDEVERFILDLETEGLRTTQKVKGLPDFGRAPGERLRISQFSFAGPAHLRKHTIKHAWTDILGTPEELMRAGVESKKYPKAWLKQISSRNARGYWDIGVRAEDNVLRGVLDRHVDAVFAGKATHTEKDLVGRMLTTIRDRLRLGKRVDLMGWNISFDWGRITEVAGHDTGLTGLLQEVRTFGRTGKYPQGSHKFTVTNARDRYQRLMFEAMLEDRKYAPRFTNHQTLDVLRGRGQRPSAAMINEITQPHRALRKFMNDLIRAKGGNASVWQMRFRKQGVEGQQIAGQLEKMAQGNWSYDSYLKMVERMHEGGHEAVFDRVYTGGKKHISVLGKATRDLTGPEGLVDNAFSYILGGRQVDVAEVMAPDFPALNKLVLRAHDSDVDRMLSPRIYDKLGKVLEEPAGSALRNRVIMRAKETRRLAAGVTERFDLETSIRQVVAEERAYKAGVEGAAAQAPKSYLREWGQNLGIKNPKTFWAKAAAITGGLYLLAERNNEPPEIEGQRYPDSMWTEMHALNPSGGPRTDFGTGRNSVAQMLGIPYGGEWLNASTLGQRGDRLTDHLQGIQSGRELDNAAIRKGEWIHRFVQQRLQDQILGSEYVVTDSRTGVRGHIDIMLASGIPLEIKTAADAATLGRLKGPRPAHISQANFYALATGAPYAYIAYFARDNPEQYRMFRIVANQAKMVEDVSNTRQAIDSLRDQGQLRARGLSFFGVSHSDWWTDAMQAFTQEPIPSTIHQPPPMGRGLYPQSTNGFAAAPAIQDYGVHKWRKFRTKGHGGLVQHQHAQAKAAKIRDQRTRLQRVQPAVSQNRRAPRPVNSGSRCEVR